jgi:RNA polymerase subunit RPABC4/transcription elongation factor Spt4
MTLAKYRTEYKKCKQCGSSFAEKSENGNPYKYCPFCRQNKWNALLRLIKKQKGEII